MTENPYDLPPSATITAPTVPTSKAVRSRAFRWECEACGCARVFRTEAGAIEQAWRHYEEFPCEELAIEDPEPEIA